MLYSFDASSVIHFYDNYQMDNPHLKSLWDWFAEKIKMVEKSYLSKALLNHHIELLKEILNFIC